MNELQGTPIEGAEGGFAPFYSPDGEWVGFISGGALRKVPNLGGPPMTLCEVPAEIRGAMWSGDRVIFGTECGGLFLVSADGGVPEPLTTPNEERGERGHGWRAPVADGTAVVFVIVTEDENPVAGGEIAVLRLQTGEVTPLGLVGVSPHYLSTGHLLYADAGGSLRAVQFDERQLMASSTPVPLVDGVMVQNSGAANFAVSQEGRLADVTGDQNAGQQRSLVWVDRDGREEPIPAPLRAYTYPRISPGGDKVALDIRDEDDDIWVWEFRSETLTRVTTSPESDQYAHWTPDGRRVVFDSGRSGTPNVYAKAADGTGSVERLTESAVAQFVNAITPDGTHAGLLNLIAWAPGPIC